MSDPIKRPEDLAYEAAAAWKERAMNTEAELERLREALGWFVADKRFQVGVGGNPNVVEAMIAEAKNRYGESNAR